MFEQRTTNVSHTYGDGNSGNPAGNQFIGRHSANNSTAWHYFTSRLDGTTEEMRRDGSTLTMSTYAGGMAQSSFLSAASDIVFAPFVGARRQATSVGFHLDGAIAEIIVYDSVLSTTDRDAVEAYLADKWGL